MVKFDSARIKFVSIRINSYHEKLKKPDVIGQFYKMVGAKGGIGIGYEINILLFNIFIPNVQCCLLRRLM